MTTKVFSKAGRENYDESIDAFRNSTENGGGQETTNLPPSFSTIFLLFCFDSFKIFLKLYVEMPGEREYSIARTIGKSDEKGKRGEVIEVIIILY